MCCEPVHTVACQRADAEALTSPPPLPKVPRLYAGRSWTDATPAGVSRIARRLFTEQFGPHAGMNPIRPDHNICLIRMAVRKANRNTFPFLFDCDTFKPVLSGAGRQETC